MDQPVIGVCARVCVRGSAISVPLWSPYGRMRGRVVEKNMRARRCIVYVSGGGFLSEGRGKEEGGDVRWNGNERRILLADENIILERVCVCTWVYRHMRDSRDLPSAFVRDWNEYILEIGTGLIYQTTAFIERIVVNDYIHGRGFFVPFNNTYPTCILFRVIIAIFRDTKGIFVHLPFGVSSIRGPLVDRTRKRWGRGV